MSLSRYTNEDYIKISNAPQFGQIFLDVDLKNLSSEMLIPTISSLEASKGRLLPEVHIYTFNGDYIGSAYDNELILEHDSNSLLFDVRQVFKLANIDRGSYKIVFNLMSPLFGRAGRGTDAESWPAFAREISPDRTEVKMTIKDASQGVALQQFREFTNDLTSIDLLNNLVVNFGSNQIYKILKIRFDKNDQNVFYLKLYKEIDRSVENLSKAFFALEPMDPYIDTVILTSKVQQSYTQHVKGPNFDMDVDDWDSQATVYQSWNDLLDTNAQTAQKIIDGVISGSGQATLNIDYSNYENFVFYSSAKERLENFHYKMELIESYSADINSVEQTLISSSELITNGDFDSDLSGWSYTTSPPITWSAGAALNFQDPAFATNHDGIISQSVTTIVGDEYTLFFSESFDYVGQGGSEMVMRVYVNGIQKHYRSTNGSQSWFSSTSFTGSGTDEIKFQLEVNGIGYPNGYGGTVRLDSVSIPQNTIITSGPLAGFSNADIAVTQQRIDTLRNSFDPMERWLYYQDTGSLFTHGVSGSLTPWPKYKVGNEYVLHDVTSSISSNWYNANLQEAESFDKLNVNSLWWSIPEHVLMDSNNSEYITFVNMVGQHFDVMYSYVDALTQIHNKDEHPERGPSGDLLYHIAKSFGWNLQNTRQLSSLWLYKLGTDDEGQHFTSSGMDVKPHEEQTKQIWRRIVNNLPYLLKTKGTSRSIKALMSIYGIPQTLISIKEYGGPGVDSDRPIAIEETFAYALNVDTGSYLKIPQDIVSASSNGWGSGLCNSGGIVEESLADLADWNQTPVGQVTFFDEFITPYASSTATIDDSVILIPGKEYTLTGEVIIAPLGDRASVEFFHNDNLIIEYEPDDLVQFINYTFTATDVDTFKFRMINDTGTAAVGKLTLVGAYEGSVEMFPRTPDTYEFRFSTKQSGSSGANVIFAHQGATTGSSDLRSVLSLVSSQELIGSASISGSENYGKVLYETYNSTTPQYGYSDWLPIFDGDLWTVRVYDETPISGTHRNDRIHIARASDCLYGRIAQSTSISMSYDTQTNDIDYVYLGGGLDTSVITANTQTSHDFTTIDFSGSVQGYKEYFTLYDNDTFYNHVLNPRAYNVMSATGSFYSLYRYLPLGLDLQREDRTIETFESSSHPDQNGQTPSLTEYVEFIGDQESQYDTWNETFYAEVPKLGGNALRGEKIRLEESSLKFQLDPLVRAETSEYDKKATDTNRLAIVFSLADQVNRDIYNHMGFEDLDDWIGDPEDQYNNNYQQLLTHNKEYFQKYQQFNDINSFIRILSLYDYTFFEQIKQLTPGRADLIAGILLENNILHRPKVVLAKKPSVNQPQWDDTIRYEVSQSGLFPNYRTTLEIPSELDVEDCYESGTIEIINEVEIDDCYLSSSIPDPCQITGSEVPVYSGSIPTTTPYDGCTGSVYDVIDQPVPDCRYMKKECYYSAYLIKDSLPANSILDDTTFWFTSSYVETVSQSLAFLNVETNKFTYGQRIETNSYISQSIETVSGSEYFLRLYARPFDTGSSTAEFRFSLNGLQHSTRHINYGSAQSLEWINEYRFTFTGTGTDTIQLEAVGDNLVIYTAEVYDYLTKWQEGWVEQSYRCYNIPVSCTYTPWHYQIDECSTRNRSRFIGSKLEGAGVNIDSPNTISGGPVITITETNPNSIFTNDGSSEGNLRLD